MDTLIKGATIVTLNEKNEIIRDGCIGASGGKIVWLSADIPEEEAGRVIDGTDKVVMPGLVNAHTHLPMTLLRGYADDYDLPTWLNKHIFPAEAKLNADSVRWGAFLGIAEAIASGTTSVSDMYYFCDEIASAAAQAGIKANIARGVTVFEPGFDFESNGACRELSALADKWHGFDNGRLRVDACIHGEYTSYPQVWRQMGDYALRRGLRMHVHLSETQKEHDGCVKKYGMTPAAAFEKEGLFRVPGIAAHCVWITQEDMDILRENHISAAHNPVSNLKLASGIAPVPAMLEKGMNVALGTDGPASNNTHDLFEEIKMSALLHKAAERDPTLIPAEQALRMATAGGALAQGRDDRTGMLALGMDADLIMLDFDRPHLIPRHSVISNLVYCARGSDVVMNMVGGHILYQNGEFTTIDIERVIFEVSHEVLPKITN